MSHFYLTLPSNSSEKYYPNNTLTHFFTKLHNDIALSGEWEVALADIMYPRNWYNVNEQSMRISCGSCTKVVPDFPPEDDTSPSYDVHVSIPSGYYNSVSELVDVLNSSITRAYKKPISPWSTGGVDRFVDQTAWPKFRYNFQNRKVILTLPPNATIQFSEKLYRILGIDASRKSSNEMNIKSMRAADIEAGLHAIYIYCDVLECVPVGDTMAPLLRIVEVGGVAGEMMHLQYDQPRYVPLQKKTFDSIEIDIRDDAGDSIPFDSGKLIVTLHFRRAKDSYFLG